VLLWLGRNLTVLALCLAIGLQWIALQSVAWTRMLVENTRHVSLTEAIAKTFDGQHPCSLCHAVQSATHKEKKSERQISSNKLDLISVKGLLLLEPPCRTIGYPLLVSGLFRRSQSPPIPPPRVALA
jgi:hypothetical protein